jgi:hypothetical protein
VIEIVALWFFSVVVLIALVARWHAPRDHWSNRMPPYWIWGESWWRGLRRARLVITLSVLGLASGGIIPTLMLPLGLTAFAIGVPLALTTFLFNWPRVLVPPALRDEKGVVTEAYQSRLGD